jgi:hypothetical protein
VTISFLYGLLKTGYSFSGNTEYVKEVIPKSLSFSPLIGNVFPILSELASPLSDFV